MPARSPLVLAQRPLWKPPTAGLAVNWAHPLSRGLASCVMMTEVGDPSVRALARPGATGTLESTNTWKTSRVGPVLVDTGTVNATNTFSSNISIPSAAISFECFYYHGASITAFAALVASSAGAYGFYINANASLIDNCTGGSTTTFTVGNSYHIAMTWDGASGKYYTNGQPDGTVTSGTPNFGSPAVFSQWLGDGAGDPPLGIGLAWFRLWARTLSAGEIAELYSTPFAHLIAPAERRRSFAILGGSSASTIVSGSESFISNSALAESAQLVAPATIQANSLLAESVQVLAPATVQSNSALVESAAQVLAPATVQSNSPLVETSAQLRAPATVQSNSLLAASAQVVETTADAALVQANSALALPTAQVVDPSLPFVSNSLLADTGGLAGAGCGTLISKSLLAESAQISAPATVQATSVLQETAAQVVAPAIVQSNSLLSVTGGLAGGGAVQGGATFASSSVLVQQSAQLRTLGTIQSNSVLRAPPPGTGPTRIVVSDAPLWATALTDAPVWAPTLIDAPLAATGLGDAATSSTGLADAALWQTVAVDAEG